MNLDGKAVAALADRVPTALSEAMSVLKKHDLAEAGSCRGTVIVAIEAAARTHQGRPSPTIADMARKITEALDAV
jgi:hypothetical protein